MITLSRLGNTCCAADVLSSATPVTDPAGEGATATGDDVIDRSGVRRPRGGTATSDYRYGLVRKGARASITGTIAS
jgi:hypothetical protein